MADALANTLAILDRLVGFDTTSVRSNLPLIDYVEDYLAGHGIASRRVPNAAGDKAALFASVGPSGDGGVLLSGHTDTVPVTDQVWESDPFVLRRAGARCYGRGAADMKGFDAICLAMMPTFRDAGLKRPIHLLLSYDEEIGCRGSLDAIGRFGADLPRPGAVIVGEPTEMAVVDAHKSIAAFETIVHGREVHSAHPERGVNAVTIACELVAELGRVAQALRAEGDPTGRFDPPCSTVHVGRITGGTARNITARRCAFAWEVRGLPGVTPTRALAALEAYLADIVRPALGERAGDLRVETIAAPAVPALKPDPGSAAEVIAKALTRSNSSITAAYGTEAGQFQDAGIPTIVCGPGSIHQAHGPDEFIATAQIEAGLAFMRGLAAALS